MGAGLPRYSKEEAAKRGVAIYERDIRSRVELENHGKYVAIDIESGVWEMDADEIAAGDRLRLRVPGAQTWLMRIGYEYLWRFGSGRPRHLA